MVFDRMVSTKGNIMFKLSRIQLIELACMPVALAVIVLIQFAFNGR